MTDIHTMQGDRLNAFLVGTATPDEALVTRAASLLLADQDPLLGTGGGLGYALRSGQLQTDAAVVRAFTLAAARVRIAMDQGALPDAQVILDITLGSHSLGSHQLSLVVQLALQGRTGTLDFTLKVP